MKLYLGERRNVGNRLIFIKELKLINYRAVWNLNCIWVFLYLYKYYSLSKKKCLIFDIIISDKIHIFRKYYYICDNNSVIYIRLSWYQNFLQDFKIFFELLSFIVCPCVVIFICRLNSTALHVYRLSVYNVVCVLRVIM